MGWVGVVGVSGHPQIIFEQLYLAKFWLSRPWWKGGSGTILKRTGAAPAGERNNLFCLHKKNTRLFKCVKMQHIFEKTKLVMLCLNMIPQWWHPMPWPHPNLSKVTQILKVQMSSVRYFFTSLTSKRSMALLLYAFIPPVQVVDCDARAEEKPKPGSWDILSFDYILTIWQLFWTHIFNSGSM